MAKRWCCVLRIGGVGDDLMASSVLPLLKQRYDAVEVITRAPAGVVFENNPHIDKLTIWPEDRPAMTDAVAWQRMLAEKALEFEPDAFFNLSNTCEATLALFEGQTDFWRPAKVRRKLCGTSYLARVHDACDLPHEFAPGFFPEENEQVRAWSTRGAIRSLMPGPVIGWCLSGSRVDKRYPYAHFAIARLISDLGANVVMLGAPTPREAQMAKEIHEQVRAINSTDRGLHLAQSPKLAETAPNEFLRHTKEAQETILAGEELWPIRRILAFAQVCDLIISPDTGPAWAVAMAKVPKIVLLSHASVRNIVEGWVNTVALHANPERTPCWPCHRLHDSFDTCVKAKGIEAAACMADIPVEAILHHARHALEQS